MTFILRATLYNASVVWVTVYGRSSHCEYNNLSVSTLVKTAMKDPIKHSLCRTPPCCQFPRSRSNQFSFTPF